MTRLIRRLSPWLAGGTLALWLPAAGAWAIDVPLPGKAAITRLNRTTDEGKLTQFYSRAPRNGPLFPIPAAGGGDDPTMVGATFSSCTTPDPGTCGTISLPASGWIGRGDPPGSKGYRYRGHRTVSDPCRRVVVSPNEDPGDLPRAWCRRPTLHHPRRHRFGDAYTHGRVDALLHAVPAAVQPGQRHQERLEG